MPLLKGKPYPLIKPSFRKNGNLDSTVYVIEHTNEKFLSKEYPFHFSEGFLHFVNIFTCTRRVT